MDWGKICRNINSIKWAKLNCNIFWYIIINLACFETSGTRQEQDYAKHTRSHWTVLKGASGLENTQILYFFGTDKNSTTWELCKYARIKKYATPWPSWHRFLTANTYESWLQNIASTPKANQFTQFNGRQTQGENPSFPLKNCFEEVNSHKFWELQEMRQLVAGWVSGKQFSLNSIKIWLKLIKIG